MAMTDKLTTFCSDLETTLKEEIEKYNQIQNALVQQEVYVRILDDRLRNYRDLLLIAQNEAEQEKKDIFPLYEPLSSDVVYDYDGNIVASSKAIFPHGSSA